MLVLRPAELYDEEPDEPADCDGQTSAAEEHHRELGHVVAGQEVQYRFGCEIRSEQDHHPDEVAFLCFSAPGQKDPDQKQPDSEENRSLSPYMNHSGNTLSICMRASLLSVSVSFSLF